MHKTKIEIDLTIKSINDAIKQLKGFKEDLKRKNDEFVLRLAEIGIPVIENNVITEGDSDPANYTHVVINTFDDYSQARLVVEGRDILFIEFGAGVHYNGAAGTSPNPKGEELGYTIGSYGKGYGTQDKWAYYDTDEGRWRVSRGTKAGMPVYNASVEIRSRILQVAKEVFG